MKNTQLHLVQVDDIIMKKNNNQNALGKKIYFERDLIKKLTKDHVMALKALQKVIVAYELKKPKKTKKKLKKFKSIFTDHLVLENLKLYLYLKHSFKKGSLKYIQVTEFRKEMKKISKYVITFVDKYKTKIKAQKNTYKFRKEFLGVYLTLKKRFKREEKELFPLYKDRY